MPTLSDHVYRFRHVSALAFVVLFTMIVSAVHLPKRSTVTDVNAITASLDQPIPPDPPKPQPVVSREVATPNATKSSEPIAPSPFATEKNTAEPPVPAPPKVEPPAPAAPVVPAQVHNLDAEYAAMIISKIEAAKHYPSSREAKISRPKGIVRLSLELERTGRVIDVQILESSHANILDNEALKTVRLIGFPAFPENAFTNQRSHRFDFNLDYDPNSNSH
jgi:TonB family protein